MRSSLEFNWTPIPSLLVYALYRFDKNHQNNKAEHEKLADYFNMTNKRTIESKLSNFKWLDTNGKSGLGKHAAIAKLIESHFKVKSNTELQTIYNDFFASASINKRINDELELLSLSWFSNMPFNKLNKYFSLSSHHGIDFTKSQDQIETLLASKTKPKFKKSKESVLIDDNDLDYVNSVNSSIAEFDKSSLPRERPKKTAASKSGKWPRDRRVGKVAIKEAGFLCEMDKSHTTFTSGSNSLVPYMEPHHLIPNSKQDDFSQRLDIVENIVSLCPNCHRKIHYGEIGDREKMIDILFNLKKSSLRDSGIIITAKEIKKYYS